MGGPIISGVITGVADYNESHDRIAIRRTDNQDYTEVGTFVNSYYKRSWYAMKGVNMWWGENWYLGFAGGASSGYLYTEAKSVVFVSMVTGVTMFDFVSVDAMLGWGQVNIGLRWGL